MPSKLTGPRQLRQSHKLFPIPVAVPTECLPIRPVELIAELVNQLFDKNIVFEGGASRSLLRREDRRLVGEIAQTKNGGFAHRRIDRNINNAH